MSKITETRPNPAAIGKHLETAGRGAGAGQWTGAGGGRTAARPVWKNWIERWIEWWSDRRVSPPRLLSVVERLEIGAKKSLLVVACGERRFLLAGHADGSGAIVELGGAARRPRPRAKLRRTPSKSPAVSGCRVAR